MTLPAPEAKRQIPHTHRPIVTAAVFGGGVCLLAAIIGLVVLGWHYAGRNEVAMTGLAAIGSTLAGGFAGWIGRDRFRDEDDRGVD